MLRFSFWCARLEWLILVSLLAIPAFAQDASSGAIRGTVFDSSGRPIIDASVALVDLAQGFRYFVTTDSAGEFVFEFLPSGEYTARAVAPDMSPQITPTLHVDVGATGDVKPPV
jgi:protocatechuate 3,4-dioxygenase beta subunit